jgi:hypothetical protein
MKLTAYEAIEYKRANPEAKLCKYADETEEFLEDVCVEYAEEIASEDPSLLYIDTDDEEGAWWVWHDMVFGRYSSTEEAEAACAAWLSGESDEGPDR